MKYHKDENNREPGYHLKYRCAQCAKNGIDTSIKPWTSETKKIEARFYNRVKDSAFHTTCKKGHECWGPFPDGYVIKGNVNDRRNPYLTLRCRSAVRTKSNGVVATALLAINPDKSTHQLGWH